MKVRDWEKSEVGRQRKYADDGRLLHCCCICGALGTWGKDWSVYCSERDLDEELPIPKFCSAKCRRQGGETAENVTEAMKQKAKDAEWREPRAAYRDATEIEKYRYAVQQQNKSG